MTAEEKIKILLSAYKSSKPEIAEALNAWGESSRKESFDASAYAGRDVLPPFEAYHAPAGRIISSYEYRALSEMQLRSEFNSLSSRFYALSQWVHNGKAVYDFNSALAAQLKEDAKEFDFDKPIPLSVIDQMPSQGIFISLPSTKAIGQFYMDGFFVNRGFTFHTLPEEKFEVTENLEFTAVMFENGRIRQMFTLAMPVNVHGIETVQDALDKMIENSSDRPGGQEARTKRTKRMLELHLEYLLYLCAENAEIKAKKNGKTGEGTKPRAPRMYKVGEQEGIRIRKMHEASYKSEHSKETEGEKREMPPHVRRSHWHSYWVGKHGTEERRIILRWLSPTVIHKEKLEDAKAVLTKVG